MNSKFKLSSVDMMSFIIQSMVGIRILRLPRVLVKVAGTDSWISVILGSGVILILSLMLYWLGNKFPGKNGPEIIVEVYGNIIGKVGVALIFIHNIFTIGLSLEIFSNSLKLYLIPNTPVYVTAGIILALGLYAFSKGFKTIATLINILLPQLLFWMGLLLILPVRNMDPQNFLPFMSNGIKPVFLGALEVLNALYGFTIIAYIMPYFKDRKKAIKWIFPGIFIVSSIYLGIISVCLMVYGADEIERLIFPTLDLAKTIELKFSLIERAESFFMIVWTISTFIMMTLTLFVSYKNLKVLFPKRKKILIYGQLPIIWLIFYLPQNTAQTDIYGEYINYLGRILILAILPITFMVVLIRERMKKSEV